MTNPTTTAPAARTQLAAIRDQLAIGGVIRLTATGPDLRIVEITDGPTNVAFRLTIETGVFQGSTVTRYVHPFEDIYRAS